MQEPVFERCVGEDAITIPGEGRVEALKVSVFLEVEGAGDYLPKYAGNLDIMTCAALEMAERISEHLDKQGGEQ